MTIEEVLKLAKKNVPDWKVDECTIRTVKSLAGVFADRPYCPLEAAAMFTGWTLAAKNLDVSLTDAYTIVKAADQPRPNSEVARAVRVQMLEIFGLTEPEECKSAPGLQEADEGPWA